MKMLKKSVLHFCVIIVVCFSASLVNAAASDEQKKIEQLESLLQFYIQENAALKAQLQDLKARVAETENAAETKKPPQDSQQNASTKDSDVKLPDKPKSSDVSTANYVTKFPKIDDETICKYASILIGTTGQYEKQWSSSPVARRYVEDAKNRGLTCGVGEPVVFMADSNKMETVDNQTTVIDDLANNGVLQAANSSFIEGRTAASTNKDYKNRTAFYETKWRENYDDFPFFEILCRVVFEADWVGLNNLEEIKSYLRKNRCTEASLKDDRYVLSDMVQSGVRVDLDGDGVRDLLVFLYGWQKKNPLRMVAFKYKWETNPDSLESPIDRLFAPEEVFANGAYPKVQNARFISTADFNEDGIVDIFYSDGGYDYKPFAIYPSKLLLSSNDGYIVKDLTKPLKIHGSAVGDFNGDGHFDIYIGKSISRIQDWGNRTDENPSLLMGDGRGNFARANEFLPGLAKSKGEEVQFAEFLDVDRDGHLDLITGGQCGRKSYIFWNDRNGKFDNENKTTIPLEYVKWGKRKCGDFYNTITQIFLLDDVETNKVYFGTTSSKHYKGNRISLFELNGRKLGRNLEPYPDIEDAGFAYKMDFDGQKTGTRLGIFDFFYKKTVYEFDSTTRKFRKIEVRNRNHKFQFPKAEIMSGR